MSKLLNKLALPIGIVLLAGLVDAWIVHGASYIDSDLLVVR